MDSSFLENRSNTTNKNPVKKSNLNIVLPKNSATSIRNLPFENFLGLGLNTIIFGLHGVFQKAISDSVNSGQKTLSIRSIVSYYSTTTDLWINFLQTLSEIFNREIIWADINRDITENFITFLGQTDLGYVTRRNRYSAMKSVLMMCYNNGFLPHIENPKELFPDNPYPNSNKRQRGKRPFSKPEYRRLNTAIRKEICHILEGNSALNSYETSVCLLAIAIRTGFNPTPLLELPADCLVPHPLKEDRMILVTFKRRGANTHLTSLKKTEELVLMKPIQFDVMEIIQLIISRNRDVRQKYSDPNLLFVFESSVSYNNAPSALCSVMLNRMYKKLVERNSFLVDDDGNPLTVNISRIRKTFANRIYELSGGDPLVAAKYGHHSVRTANKHYWEPPADAERNFRMMGEIRVKDILESNEKRQESPTPIALCADTTNGHLAPQNGNHCTEILACFRCKSFVVTKDDLHKLFSFYWAIIEDRNITNAKSWKRHFRHIREIIDNDIAQQFNAKEISRIKKNAKLKRHPYWKDLTMLRMGK